MFMAEGVGKLLAAGLDEMTMKKILHDNAENILAGRLR